MFTKCSFTFLNFPHPGQWTDAWITFEDEEDEEEEGGDGDAMHALFEEEQDAEETDVESNYEDLDDIFELF